MISSANLPKTNKLTSTFLHDYPETFSCSLTLQLLSLTSDVNFAWDSYTPPVMVWMEERSVREDAIMLRVPVVASSSKFNKNFSLMTNRAWMAKSPNF